ncbi:MAG: SPOR domain-containing protein [Cyanobacteria bacterium J06631_2]
MNCYKYSCLSLLTVIVSLNSAIAPSSGEIPTSQQVDATGSSPVYVTRNNRREYTFKAPDSKTLSNSSNLTGDLTAAQGYKVEVYGSGKELLLEVRDIEPKAFIKGNIIQVGIFSQQNNAEDMVRQLASQGFWARIVTQ